MKNANTETDVDAVGNRILNNLRRAEEELEYVAKTAGEESEEWKDQAAVVGSLTDLYTLYQSSREEALAGSGNRPPRKNAWQNSPRNGKRRKGKRSRTGRNSGNWKPPG